MKIQPEGVRIQLFYTPSEIHWGTDLSLSGTSDNFLLFFYHSFGLKFSPEKDESQPGQAASCQTSRASCWVISDGAGLEWSGVVGNSFWGGQRACRESRVRKMKRNWVELPKVGQHWWQRGRVMRVRMWSRPKQGNSLPLNRTQEVRTLFGYFLVYFSLKNATFFRKKLPGLQ